MAKKSKVVTAAEPIPHIEDHDPPKESHMSTQEILIQKKTFSAPAPFAEGHVLTANEAEVLNQTLAENLRNNFAARMRAAAEQGQELTQDDFDAYATSYKFGQRVARASTKDPVAAEERKLAGGAVRRQILAKGFKLKDIPDETLEAYINQAVATGKFRAEAERMVAAKSIELDLYL